MRSYTCNFPFFRKQVSNLAPFWVHHYLRSTWKQQKLAWKLVQWTEMIAIFFLWPIKSKVYIMGMDDWFNRSSGLAQKPMSQFDELNYLLAQWGSTSMDLKVFCQTFKWQQSWLRCTVFSKLLNGNRLG